MKNVLIEPWYAGLPDENGNLYSVLSSSSSSTEAASVSADGTTTTTTTNNLNYRGRLYNDPKTGYYRYVQTFPSKYVGRTIQHVHFKTTVVPNDDEEEDDTPPPPPLVTQMYFEGMIPSRY